MLKESFDFFVQLTCFHLKILLFFFPFQPATSLEIQLLLYPSNLKGILVECNSRGWFPEPQMEWRDSRGELITPASKSVSQDGDKLFNMHITLLLNSSSYGNITCCLRNPVTGQEERTSLVLSGEICTSHASHCHIIYKLTEKVLSSLLF